MISVLLDINEQLPASGGKRSDTDILAGIRSSNINEVIKTI